MHGASTVGQLMGHRCVSDLNQMVWIHHDRGTSNAQVYPREVVEKKQKERTEEETIIDIVLKVKVTYVKKETNASTK
jgi:hypothetical protein